MKTKYIGTASDKKVILSDKQNQAVNLIFGPELAKSIITEVEKQTGLAKTKKKVADLAAQADEIEARVTQQEIKQGFRTHMGANFFPAKKQAITGIAQKFYANGKAKPEGLAPDFFKGVPNE